MIQPASFHTHSHTSRRHSIQWHSLIRAVWIGGLAIYIFHLKENDSLHYYLAPTMQRLLLCCPIPLLFIAVIMAWHGLFGHGQVHCDCEHPPPSGGLRSLVTYGLIMFPLLLSFCCRIKHSAVLWPVRRACRCLTRLPKSGAKNLHQRKLRA